MVMVLVDLTTSKESRWNSSRSILGIIGDQKPYSCYQCSKCSSGCLSAELLELMPHQVVSMIKLGFLDEVISSDIIWLCAYCLKCVERCPQNVAPAEAILALRNIAFERGVKTPEGYRLILENVFETGWIQSFQPVIGRDGEIYVRDNLDLPKKPEISNMDGFREALAKTLGEEG